jgi:hypothetical protein
MNKAGGEFINSRTMREITPEWERLFRVASIIGRGTAMVVFNEGRPVQIDIVVKKIKLDSNDEFEEKLKTIPLL